MIAIVVIMRIVTALPTSCLNDITSITILVDLLPQVNYGHVLEVSLVALASPRVIPGLRSRDLLVALLSGRLLYFLLSVGTSRLLSVLVALDAPVVLAVVIPSRVGYSS